MEEREMLEEVLNFCSSKSITTIFQDFLNTYEEKLSFYTIKTLHKMINNSLEHRLEKAERALYVANERADYLKKYLDGSMWKDEELAKLRVQPQIENAQAILDAVKEVK